MERKVVSFIEIKCLPKLLSGFTERIKVKEHIQMYINQIT